jgi:hypothetical protein
MFGDKMDAHITMLQRIVALVRDLVIAVVAALTALIIAYGGDPASLNALDWTRLVGAAFLVVLGPVAVFLVMKVLYALLYELMAPIRAMFPGAPPPTGWVALVIPPPEIQRGRRIVEAFASRFPRTWYVVRLLVNFVSVKPWQKITHPYLYAMVAVLLCLIVFRDTLHRYVRHTPQTRPNSSLTDLL